MGKKRFSAEQIIVKLREAEIMESKGVTQDEELLRSCVIDLASKYGRYGYKRITALLNEDGWRVNHKGISKNRIKS